MSKSIKIDASFIETAKADFIKMCDEGKFIDGKIVFNRTIATNTGKKATLSIEDLAWRKMKALVDEFDKEIAWHGIAKRGETENEYVIEDVLVYPQTVTAATVETDQEKYQMWLYSQEDDVFNHIRMQGHSHVNMNTSPSGVDTTYYERIVEQMGNEDFYIFMILNKKGSRYVNIYDMKSNTIFETSDVTVTLLIDPEDPIHALIKDAKEKVKDEPKPVVTPAAAATRYAGTSYNNYTGYGNGYGNGYYGNYNTGKSATPKKPVVDSTGSPLPGYSASEYNKYMNDPMYDGYDAYEYY